MEILKQVYPAAGFSCECVGCYNKADYYVTDGTEYGEGYICKSCNDKDELAETKGWD